jgi:putative ABC transport system ATP-binding protein
LCKTYGAGDTKVEALKNVSFTVSKGEFVSVIGPSGSGKSTLLNMIGALDYPTSGKVIVDGRDIYTMKEEELSVFRRRNIGFVFQAYNLVPELNVEENIVLPILLDYKKPDQQYIDELLAFWGWRNESATCPASFPADSSSVWLSGGHWRPNRPLSLPTSPPATLTARTAGM